MKAFVAKQGRIVKSIAIINPKLKVKIALNEVKGIKLSEIELPNTEFRSKTKLQKRFTELGAKIKTTKTVKRVSGKTPK